MEYVDQRVAQWIAAGVGNRSRSMDWAAYDAARTAWRRGRVVEGRLLAGELAMDQSGLLERWTQSGEIGTKFTSLRPQAVLYFSQGGVHTNEIVQQMLAFRIEAFQAELDAEECKWLPEKSSLATWFRNGAVLQLPRTLRAIAFPGYTKEILLEPGDHLFDRVKGAWQRRDEQEYTDLIEEFLLELPPRLRRFIGRFLAADLDQHSRQAAAEILGISRRTLGLRISEAKHHGNSWRRRQEVESAISTSNREGLKSISEGRGGRA